MKFTLSWLKEHLDTNASVEEIAKTLTRIGLEVEEVIDPAAKLNGFMTAKVVTCERHPDSDHLNLLKVDNGKEEFQVVCGAPNCHAGLVGIFAPTGVIIPSVDQELKVGKIRGVESFGMMCSERELEVGDDQSGIIELSADTKIGAPAAEILDIDPVFDISITPNRAECLGVRGIARDLAAAGLGKLKELKISHNNGSFKSPVKVKTEDFKAAPTYVGRYIKGVNNKAETPKWMKDRLTAIGLRPISPLVDITNYINYDLARPLHVFDADKLKGDVTVRMANDGEKFISLEDKEYSLDDKSLSICDDEGIQCLGGIMGGIGKGVTEDTKNVFLEAALFCPECIARTGRKFQIDSDSRYRYERWVDPKSNILGSDYAVQMILDICGGEVSEMEISGTEDYEEKVAYLRPERVKDLIGLDVPKTKIIEILSNLGFKVSDEGGKIKAVSPSWRGDIEFEQDLIEEVVRMIGLDEIPALSMPVDTFPAQTLDPAQRRIVTARHELASRGMYETVTWSFTDSNIAEMFRMGKEPIMLLNPLSSELNEMRPSILPNLLLGLKNNIAKGYANVSLFETGPQFYGHKPGEQQYVFAGLRSGMTSKRDWHGEMRAFDLFDVKADALAVIAAANGPWDNVQIKEDAPDYYHPGRSGTMRLGKTVLAYFGEIHPQVAKKMGIKQRVMAMEVFVDNIPLPRASQGKSKKRVEMSQFQPVDKDFAFIVDKDIKAYDVIIAAKYADRNLITDVRVFDVYEGDNLPDGKKSLALSITFQPTENTFSDKDIENLMAKVALEVKKKTGAVLRDA